MPITYYLSFDNKDKRREITCGLYKIDENFQYDWIERGISQGKFGRHWLENPPGKSTAKGTGINWPMMRYSDVLLMFVEAENELNGPTSLASEALKRVRQRAFDANDWSEKVDQYVATAAASKEAFFNAIVDERAWEFGGEMIRKYELIRWGIYDDKIKETVDGLKLIADRREQASTYNLPDYIFWKVNADGQFEVLNPDSYLSAAPDDTWTRESFINSLWDDTKGNYQDFILRDWENHLNPPWGGNFPRYIFPIPTSAIEASQGKLLNDGYQF